LFFGKKTLIPVGLDTGVIGRRLLVITDLLFEADLGLRQGPVSEGSLHRICITDYVISGDDFLTKTSLEIAPSTPRL